MHINYYFRTKVHSNVKRRSLDGVFWEASISWHCSLHSLSPLDIIYNFFPEEKRAAHHILVLIFTQKVIACIYMEPTKPGITNGNYKHFLITWLNAYPDSNYTLFDIL